MHRQLWNGGVMTSENLLQKATITLAEIVKFLQLLQNSGN